MRYQVLVFDHIVAAKCISLLVPEICLLWRLRILDTHGRIFFELKGLNINID